MTNRAMATNEVLQRPRLRTNVSTGVDAVRLRGDYHNKTENRPRRTRTLSALCISQIGEKSAGHVVGRPATNLRVEGEHVVSLGDQLGRGLPLRQIRLCSLFCRAGFSLLNRDDFTALRHLKR